MEKVAPCRKGFDHPEYNKEGRCCCNCEHQKSITGHPGNKLDGTKTQITKIIGWGCLPPEFFPNIVFVDHEHSMCEMHTHRQYHLAIIDEQRRIEQQEIIRILSIPNMNRVNNK